LGKVPSDLTKTEPMNAIEKPRWIGFVETALQEGAAQRGVMLPFLWI